VHCSVALISSDLLIIVVYLAGGWYTKNELGRRLAIINMATSAGPMFGSFLQAAIYKGMNGHRGLRGWQWVGHSVHGHGQSD
jgi:ACS family pantothenate transporter-like MFS transporter